MDENKRVVNNNVAGNSSVVKYATCMIVTVIAIILIAVCSSKISQNNLSNSSLEIKQVTGTISSIESDENSFTLKVLLENGDTKYIGIGGSNSYHKGETINVYTDGRYYELTSAGVELDASDMFIYYMLIIFSLSVLIITWLVAFGGKGVHKKSCCK